MDIILYSKQNTNYLYMIRKSSSRKMQNIESIKSKLGDDKSNSDDNSANEDENKFELQTGKDENIIIQKDLMRGFAKLNNSIINQQFEETCKIQNEISLKMTILQVIDRLLDYR